MKKLLILFTIIIFGSSISDINAQEIKGKWKGEDEKKEIGHIIFDDEGYVTIEAQGETFGGKEFEMNGEKGSMSYTINSSTKPIQIDLIMTKLKTQEQRKMLLIVEFKDDDTIIIASNFNSVRPAEFNADNSITFQRVK